MGTVASTLTVTMLIMIIFFEQTDLLIIFPFQKKNESNTINYNNIMYIQWSNYLRNEFHFSEVYRSVNYIGSRAK